MEAKIIRHSRGNHNDIQLLNYGKVIFRGNVTEVKKELAYMRNNCRTMWHSASTDSNMRDYIEYQMGEISAFKCVNGSWERIY